MDSGGKLRVHGRDLHVQVHLVRIPLPFFIHLSLHIFHLLKMLQQLLGQIPYLLLFLLVHLVAVLDVGVSGGNDFGVAVVGVVGGAILNLRQRGPVGRARGHVLVL